jgi:hypothetical protein
MLLCIYVIFPPMIVAKEKYLLTVVIMCTKMLYRHSCYLSLAIRSHRGAVEYSSLVGSDAVPTGIELQTFLVSILPPFPRPSSKRRAINLS